MAYVVATCTDGSTVVFDWRIRRSPSASAVLGLARGALLVPVVGVVLGALHGIVAIVAVGG